MTPGPDQETGRWALLALVCVLVFLDSCLLTALVPLLPHYVHTLHLTGVEAGALSGSYAIGMVVSAVPAGVLVTRLGVRPIMTTGVILLSTSSLVFASALTFEVATGARAAQGLAGACIWAAALEWLTRSWPGQRGTIVGALNAVGVGGGIAGPGLGVAVREIGAPMVFGTVAALALVLGIASWVNTAPRPAGRLETNLAGAMRERRVLGGFVLTALCSAVFGCLAVTLPLRLSAAGWDTSAIGGLFVLVSATLAVTSAVVGRLSDRHGRSGPILIALAVGAGGTMLLAADLAPLAVGIAAAATEVGLGTMLTPAMAWLVDGADARAVPAGVSSGLMNAAWAVGQGSGGIVAGAALRVAPSITYIGLSIACTAAAAAVRLGRRSPTWVT